VLQADAPGEVLSAASGADVLSDAGGFGVTFQGTLTEFANALISGFSAKDLIDITDLDSATVSTSYAGSAGAGVLVPDRRDPERGALPSRAARRRKLPCVVRCASLNANRVFLTGTEAPASTTCLRVSQQSRGCPHAPG